MAVNRTLKSNSTQTSWSAINLFISNKVIDLQILNIYIAESQTKEIKHNFVSIFSSWVKMDL